jgi:hypothetical protein
MAPRTFKAGAISFKAHYFSEEKGSAITGPAPSEGVCYA